MVIHTYGHSRTYEMEALLKLFRPAEKFAFSEAETVPAEDEYLSASLTPEKDGTLLLTGSVRIGGETRSHTKTLPEQVRNNGYRDRIYIEEHHEAIVSPELFERVQKRIAMNKGNRRSA